MGQEIIYVKFRPLYHNSHFISSIGNKGLNSCDQLETKDAIINYDLKASSYFSRIYTLAATGPVMRYEVPSGFMQ